MSHVFQFATTLSLIIVLSNLIISQLPAQEREPQTVQEYFERGKARLGQMEHEKAIQDFTQVIKLQPKIPVGYMYRSAAELDLGNYKAVIKDSEELLRLVPSSTAAREHLAYFLSCSPDDDVRDGERAVSIATKLCELDQWKNAKYLDTLAMAYAEAGDFEKAIQWETKAIELAKAKSAPEGAMDTFTLKRAQNRLELYKAGKPYRDPPIYQSHYIRALQLMGEKKYDEALSYFGLAVRLNPDKKWWKPYALRGTIYYGTGKDELAISELKKVVALAPAEEAFSSYQELAALLSSSPVDRLRDGKQAVSLATRVCELTEWNDANALQTLAIAYAESGDFDAAVIWQTKAMQLAASKAPKGWDSAAADMLLKLFTSHKPFRYRG